MSRIIDDLTDAIMSSMDCAQPSKFRIRVQRILQQVFYKPATKPGSRPEDAVVAVHLRIGDWMEIRDSLFIDAHAEGPGPATKALASLQIVNEIMRERAGMKDAADYCHANHAATSRCAYIIDETLREYGWTK